MLVCQLNNFPRILDFSRLHSAALPMQSVSCCLLLLSESEDLTLLEVGVASRASLSIDLPVNCFYCMH